MKAVKPADGPVAPPSPPSPPFFRGLGEIGSPRANPGAAFAAFARATAGETRAAGAWPGAVFTAFTVTRLLVSLWISSQKSKKIPAPL